MAAMFTLPPHTEGTSDDHPIIITLPARATVDDFRAFIFFLLPSLKSDIVWDIAAWTGVLRIANWAMLESARDVAIHHLDQIVKTWAPTQLYRFAHEHRVPQWHVHAIKELLCRPQGMTSREIDELGIDITVQIINLRVRAERAATVRIYDQMHQSILRLAQGIYTEHGGIATMEQMHGLLESVHALTLRYRTALPGVASTMGIRWANVLDDAFVIRHFPIDFE